MKNTTKDLKKLAKQFGYDIEEGSKHIKIMKDGVQITSIPRGFIANGTYFKILKHLKGGKQILNGRSVSNTILKEKLNMV